MASSGDKASTRDKKSSSSSSNKKSKKDKEPSSIDQRKKEKKKSKRRSKSPKPSKEVKTSSSIPGRGQPPPPQESQAFPQTQHSPPLPPEKDPKASQDFEAGQLFQKFARNGGVDARDFQRLWRQRGESVSSATTKDGDSGRQSAETASGKEQAKTLGDDAREMRPEKTFECCCITSQRRRNFLKYAAYRSSTKKASTPDDTGWGCAKVQNVAHKYNYGGSR